MIARIIEWSLRNRFIVACATLFLIAWGVRAIYRTPVDAIPDLSENQVIVFADWMGRSPQEVEDQVTYPLSVNLQGLAGVKSVRATSMFGFSLITIIFDDDVDNYFARTRVLERLNYLSTTLPKGVTPQLGPDATGLGWVYQYYLEVDPKAVSAAATPGFQTRQNASPSPLNGERAGVRGGATQGPDLNGTSNPPLTLTLSPLRGEGTAHLATQVVSSGTASSRSNVTASARGYDLGQLRAIQDWFIRYQLNSVPGVAEVASIGGFVRQYQVEVSSLKMRAVGVSLQHVLEAVEQSNLNVGGKVIEENGMEFVVRGVGLINSLADIEQIVVMQTNGTPVYLRDIAQIQVGGDFRRGTLDINGREVVGGIVVMRTGENARDVIARVKEKIAQITPSLPPGVTIKPFYDRSELIERTIDTLKHALWEEVILVTLAHIIFLWHFRSILIVTLPLPVSILISFILMKQFGITSNIMSLSGIAIAIGVLVDAAIVMTENVLRRCEQAEEEKRLAWQRGHAEQRAVPPHPDPHPQGEGIVVDVAEKSVSALANPAGGEHASSSGRKTSTDSFSLSTRERAEVRGKEAHTRLTPAETWRVVLEASTQVGRPIFFAMAIIILAFIPVFALVGQEGKLFHPLAFTKTFAMIGSTLLAVTIVPVLCTWLVRGPFHSEDRNIIMRALLRLYDPVLNWALVHRKTVMSLAAVLLAVALVLAFGLPRPVFTSVARLLAQERSQSDLPLPSTGRGNEGEGEERGVRSNMADATGAATPHPSPLPVEARGSGMRSTERVTDAELISAFHANFPRLARALSGMGSEFMPPLNEGSLLFMPVLLPSTSLTEVKRIMAWQDRVMASVPEVASVGGKLGRAETATDPAPVEMIETTIMLKPEYITTNRTFLGFIKVPWRVRNPEWRDGMTPEKLVAELSDKLTQVPGYVPGFLQPIENRILMLSTGIRAQVGVKIFGDNLEALQAKAFEVERVVRSVEGAVGVAPSRVQGKPYLEVEVDRIAMARFGLRAEDVMRAVETGLGGMNVTTTIEGRERVPIQVRLERSEREDIERIGDLLVATPFGQHVPLAQVATIRRSTGPSEIASENGRLRVFVQANVQDRDLGGFVKELRERIAKEVPLERGMTVEFSGQYENQIRAQRTLTVIVPTVLLIIFVLLYIVYGSVKEAAHVILAVPFALTGGVFLQYALGYNFSVAVWVGYIALFGTAIQTGVVMVVYLEEMLKKKQAERGTAFNRDDLLQAIKDGARLRLRPKVMTVATIVASLLPIMWSTRTGAEVMKPLATPVIGGMVSSLIHILIVTPVIFAWLRERELKRVRASSGTE
jgi:Cu/Ag efflux pump CusA